MKEPRTSQQNKDLELGTLLPFGLVVLLDEENPKIMVDWFFMRRMITRLNSLNKIAPNYLAKADIPDARKYILDAYKKVKKSWNK